MAPDPLLTSKAMKLRTSEYAQMPPSTLKKSLGFFYLTSTHRKNMVESLEPHRLDENLSSRGMKLVWITFEQGLIMFQVENKGSQAKLSLVFCYNETCILLHIKMTPDLSIFLKSSLNFHSSLSQKNFPNLES
jgi:hypothetical protein